MCFSDSACVFIIAYAQCAELVLTWSVIASCIVSVRASPEKPEQLCGPVSALAPREDKQAHGNGMTCISFYSQAKKRLKLKTVAKDDEKAWRSKRQAKDCD